MNPKLSLLPAILLVEDEDFVRNVTCEILQASGWVVFGARNAGEAARLSVRHCGQLGILITDVMLPDKNGRTLAREMKHALPHLRTLLISGYPETRANRKELAREHLYLTKPFSQISLMRKVSVLMRQIRRAQREHVEPQPSVLLGSRHF